DLAHVERINSNASAGDRAVTITSWKPEKRVFQVAAGSEPTLRVRTYFYPHWKAISGGQSLPVSAADDGTIMISVPPRAANVELIFQEPSRVRVFEIISG